MNCTAIRAEDGRRITLPQPVGLELKCTCSSPARQATLTFGIETPLPLLAQLQIEQYARRTPLFSGAIDEQVFSCGQSGPRVMLSARSLGGALLDYEALPASYNQPDLQAIFCCTQPLMASPLCVERGAAPAFIKWGRDKANGKCSPISALMYADGSRG